jgi:hypothetical protein
LGELELVPDACSLLDPEIKTSIGRNIASDAFCVQERKKYQQGTGVECYGVAASRGRRICFPAKITLDRRRPAMPQTVQK